MIVVQQPMIIMEQSRSQLENNFTIIKQGAEGRLYKGIYLGRPVIVKERFQKKYRHPELDTLLTTERMKAEARAIVRCKIAGVCVPSLYLVDFERRCIFLEDIANSVIVKDYITELLNNLQKDQLKTKQKLSKLTKEIGVAIAKIHNSHLIHGDLTTSNLLVKLDNTGITNQLFLVDFGLSFVGQTPEDKGVDLYVLERAIISTHPNTEDLFSSILASYKTSYKGNIKEVMTKFEDIRARGRKRTMVG